MNEIQTLEATETETRASKLIEALSLISQLNDDQLQNLLADFGTT